MSLRHRQPAAGCNGFPVLSESSESKSLALIVQDTPIQGKTSAASVPLPAASALLPQPRDRQANENSKVDGYTAVRGLINSSTDCARAYAVPNMIFHDDLVQDRSDTGLCNVCDRSGYVIAKLIYHTMLATGKIKDPGIKRGSQCIQGKGSV
jgi:hypothetical protein